MKRSSVSAVTRQRISPCHIDILLAESARSAGHAPPRLGSRPVHFTIDYRTPLNSRGHSGRAFRTGEIDALSQHNRSNPDLAPPTKADADLETGHDARRPSNCDP